MLVNVNYKVYMFENYFYVIHFDNIHFHMPYTNCCNQVYNITT